MKKYKWIIILLNLLLLLAYFNYSVIKKEELLKNGQLVLLELAPVDPRSLMQGDYMILRYAISENLNLEEVPRRGYCIVKIDTNGVAHKVRFQDAVQPLEIDQHAIAYTAPDKWNVNIGAESFFFEEGQGEKYEKAKYGAVKIDEKGNSLLVGLYDAQLDEIK